MAHFYSSQTFKKTHYYQKLPLAEQHIFDVLSEVFHFKTNSYVLENLIDWEKLPDDPIYRLNFPNPKMLGPQTYQQLLEAHEKNNKQVAQVLRQFKAADVKMQSTLVPTFLGKPIPGAYRPFPNLLFLFPAPMVKTCHAYCSYCFRWKQFVDHNLQTNQSYSYSNPNDPVAYLLSHPEITDILFTGADPLVLPSSTIEAYVTPTLAVDSVETIQFSSKALAWWPYRFTTDKDAGNLLRLFEHIVDQGKHLSFVAHFTHVRELENDAVVKAIHSIQNTGAVIRCQGPIAEGINDHWSDWANLWTRQISLAMIPTYMYMESDHNREAHFRTSLAKALRVFQMAQQQTSGLTRTVRGPVFMNDIHRVLLDGIVEVDQQKYFVLKCIQSPYPESEGKVKLIPYDEHTSSAGDLVAMFTPETEREVFVTS